MPNTVFIPAETVVTSSWAQEVNDLVHKVFNAANNVAAARTALGLGDAAVKDVGTAADEVAAGDHTHGDTLGSLTPTNNNFVVGTGTAWAVETPAAARTSLGLGDAATKTVGILTGNVPDLTDAKLNASVIPRARLWFGA